MSDDDRLHSVIESYAQAVDRLGEALDAIGRDSCAADAAIQRFEFTFELAWKCLKRALAAEGIQRETPRAVLRKSFRVGWIEDEAAWLAMIADRNLTSHVYSEARAREVLERVATYHPALQRLRGRLDSIAGA